VLTHKFINECVGKCGKMDEIAILTVTVTAFGIFLTAFAIVISVFMSYINGALKDIREEVKGLRRDILGIVKREIGEVERRILQHVSLPVRLPVSFSVPKVTDEEVKRAVSKLTREKIRKEVKRMREETPMFDRFDDETKFALLTFRVAGMIEDGKIDEEEIEKIKERLRKISYAKGTPLEIAIVLTASVWEDIYAEI